MFDIGEVHRRRYSRVKRVVDVALGVAGAWCLVARAPRSCWSATSSRNRGPLFYRQTRVGKGGEPFTILKFRTMRPDAATALRRASGPDERRPPRSPVRPASCGAPTSTSCPRCSTSSAATCRSSGPAPSSPTTSRS